MQAGDGADRRLVRDRLGNVLLDAEA